MWRLMWWCRGKRPTYLPLTHFREIRVAGLYTRPNEATNKADPDSQASGGGIP